MLASTESTFGSVPPFADLVAAKHVALSLTQPHEKEDRTCQATVRQTRPNI